ncbi:NYN domain-containing protein [Cellulomonas chengniuliangii]|uniref:NYN domain-containing protein n=1 Tax=Cellulomonas chengniuliangii TaxID=2968084 RepID=A0ABY5L142_9CELL|nr:NYN domain-containing protein [Cellulomonas chengniuliangii]MCC2307583.1 NYN domain-containing protein [Cellulomonas chengniuliangii]MCC2318693.1 NYN domain-containing protein [Cellulomonas chengniuliangii]UUI75648.1 NYN domain-containing protein [Cellulomonas chengniuliangii]
MSAAGIVDRPEPVRSFRCALFVDFDNVYIGLRRLDPAAADAFANNPAHWLSELESGTDSEGEFTRRFLVRACYLNPSAFSQFRPNFTRAGFQVVDCPSLTQQGKSSADINLVLDAVDALNASTRYEEFVIVSADADFTPLALRCRADDRRVTIITAGPAAAAYRAVADAVVTADDLAELVMPAVETAAVAEIVESEPSRERTAAATEPVPAEAAPQPASSSPGRRAALRSVRAADRPILAGSVAQIAQKADPTLPATRWEGAGSFFAWLAQHVPEVAAASRPAPGFVWDPKRFGEADLPGAVADVDPSALQRQVVAVTDTPGLSAKQYRVVLTALAADLAAHPFERAETSRRVRDVCRAKGALVGRSTVNYVISGVLFAGLTLGPGTSARDLAEAWAENVVGLCRGARMELSPGDVAAIRAWVGGGLLDA